MVIDCFEAHSWPRSNFWPPQRMAAPRLQRLNNLETKDENDRQRPRGVRNDTQEGPQLALGEFGRIIQCCAESAGAPFLVVKVPAGCQTPTQSPRSQWNEVCDILLLG
jgi:hypothetical protein